MIYQENAEPLKIKSIAASEEELPMTLAASQSRRASWMETMAKSGLPQVQIKKPFETSSPKRYRPRAPTHPSKPYHIKSPP